MENAPFSQICIFSQAYNLQLQPLDLDNNASGKNQHWLQNSSLSLEKMGVYFPLFVVTVFDQN